MVLGMNLALMTRLHVMESLIGLGTGLLMALGMIRGRRWPFTTGVFIATTALTIVTGFFFPFLRVAPAIVFGILALIALGMAIVARYGMRMAGGWRKAWVVFAMTALYVNFFIFIVQLFVNTPAIQAMGERQKETLFAAVQLGALVGFTLWTVKAARQFWPEGVAAASAAAAPAPPQP